MPALTAKHWSRTLVILTALIVASVTLLLSLALFVKYQQFADAEKNSAASGTTQRYRLLDGRPLPSGTLEQRPYAVPIDNHIDAPAPAGLEEASIIYEVVVEGEITRFLAIIGSDVSASQIGPVRSLRPFFIALAEEWDAVTFHAGGSPDALELLKTSPLVSVNEISADGIYFWRDSNSDAPHNLYTSSALQRRAAEAKAATGTVSFLPWQFKDSTPESGDLAVENVVVNFSSDPDYQVEYRYNRNTNDYTRYRNGAVHKTLRGIVLKADTVIIQHVNYDIIDDYGRLDIDLDSGGAASVYQAGGQLDGVWQKNNGRTRFYDDTGREIQFNRGTTWVALVFN